MGLQFTVEDAPDLTIPEDYPVRATVKDIKLRENDWTDPKTRETKTISNLEWFFEVTSDGPYTGRVVRGRTKPVLNNRDGNRFRQWAETLLGRELGVGAGIDADDLLGLACEITVSHEPDRKNPEIKWDRVDEVLPVTGGFNLNEPPF